MVVGYLNLASLEAMASRLVVGSSGFAIMADQNGIIIAHPNKKSGFRTLESTESEGDPAWLGRTKRGLIGIFSRMKK